MKLTVAIYLPQHSAFPIQHLWGSLLNQSLSPDEVLIYGPSELMPNPLPAAWRQIDAPANRKLWLEDVLQTAQGEYLAFVCEGVIFNRKHFELNLKALKQSKKAAVVSSARYLDQELIPLPDATLPHLESQDWLGWSLASRLLWPLETLIVRRQSFDTQYYQVLDDVGSLAECAEWLQMEAIPVVNHCTVDVPWQQFWKSQASEERQNWFKDLLQSQKPLVPSYALPQGKTRQNEEILHRQFISQALREWGLTALIDSHQHRLQNLSLGLSQVLWLIADDARPWLPFLESLVTEGIFPTVVLVDPQPQFAQADYQVSYYQENGIAFILVKGLPEVEQNPLLSDPPRLQRMILDWVYHLRPHRIHMTSFRYFSPYLPHALLETRTPVYYSCSDDSAFLYRQALRYPEASSRQKQPLKLLKQHNQRIAHALKQEIAGVFLHDSTAQHRWLNAGEELSQAQTVRTPQEMVAFYQKAPVLYTPEYTASGFSMLESLTGTGFEQRITQDVERFAESPRVLSFGFESPTFVSKRIENKAWAKGICTHPSQVRQAQANGLPIEYGSLSKWPGPVRGYDTVYFPYVLSSLNWKQWRQVFTSATLALHRGGKLAMRLFTPAFYQQSAFWLGEHQKRPWSPSLLKAQLQQAGYELQVEDYQREGWPDLYLEATLKTDGLPLHNLPVCTQRIDNYWGQALPNLMLGEDEEVLLIGTHIQKLWMINRVMCGYMLGITLNFNELNKRQKPSAKYAFSHSSDILQTARRLKRKFDQVILQGVVETLLPAELEELLSVCYRQLKPQGKLRILSMQCDDSQDDPLFWQSALNVRPYPDLEPLLLKAGFQIESREMQNQHHNYDCVRAQASPNSFQAPALPAAVRHLIKQAKRIAQPENLQAILSLAPQSQQGIILFNFEHIPPTQLDQALEQLHQALEQDGALIVTFESQRAWDDPLAYRLYPEALVDKILQEAGFQKRSLSRHGTLWVWYGFRRLSYQVLPTPPLRMCWQGDVLNYHSLAQVNRNLLGLSLQHIQAEWEIMPYSDPSFEPTQGTELTLLRHHALPLSGPADITVRHHWPPDFNGLDDSNSHWVMIQPWEFGSLPERWIYNMNKFVDQVWVPSEYVKQCYLNSGLLNDKIAVIPNGVDCDLFSPQAPVWVLPTEKRFKFLFVGGGTLRKGVDLLLNAFVETFDATEDVCLIIKEFGSGTVYAALGIAEWIERYRKQNPNMPEIIHLTDEINSEDMPALYNSSDCLVHPFRGEGFALTVAEAMACAKPVLVTEYGPVLEYCSPENAYFIPAEEVPFKEKQIDHVLVTVDYPRWAEPDYEALKALLRHIYENPREAALKGEKGREMVCEKLTWRHSLFKMEEQIQKLSQLPVFRKNREVLLNTILGHAFHAIEKEEYALAISEFQKALQIDPYQPSVAYNLGVAYIMSEQHEKALEVLTRSLREGEVTADLCYAMGTALRNLGDYVTSQHFFGKAKALNPAIFA